jgi:aldehyde:ferredoxin oxidoreductase
MAQAGDEFFGYQGAWAWVDLTNRTIRIEPADTATCRDYLGGRGVQARLMFDHLRGVGRHIDPLGPDNRIIVGTAAPNDTRVPTTGRGSCSFISPMTRSPEPAAWIAGHAPLHGLLTHSSAGGLLPNMLKRAGIDQLIIDGRADRPVRLLVTENAVRIVDAEDALFETVGGSTTLRPASAVTDYLAGLYPGSSSVCAGPAGWNKVAFACLTSDHHRNFGRGGPGAVFGSKNLVAISASGRRSTRAFDPVAFERLGREIDALIESDVGDPLRTASFRPMTGTTWWLDRAFSGRYRGEHGGYLPWHNFDEGHFDPARFAAVGTDAFLEFAGRHHVCNRCRHIMCTRAAKVEQGPFAGEGVRPEFETIALWINCCLLDRDAIFHLNRRCNALGVDTMTFGSVMAGALDLAEQGLLAGCSYEPAFGSASDMVRTLDSIAYQSDDVGRLFGQHADRVIAELAARSGPAAAPAIARAVTTAFGGLGYAGIEPKVFPGMFTAYGTSNRGRGDHTYAWTIQAEEGGLGDAEGLAAYVAEGQAGKALVDSLGLCDFFTADILSDQFLGLYRALTGFEYSAEAMRRCGEAIYALERHVNNLQGRARAYDAYVPAKMTEPLTAGPQAGKAVDPVFYNEILDAYYRYLGWTASGVVGPERLRALGIPDGRSPA